MERAHRRPPPTVLIVDDNLGNVQVLGRLLREHGYRIYVARSGEEALETAEEVTPEVILLDVMMPGIDGFETCRRLKATDKTRRIPVLFLTALSAEEDVVRAFKAGAVDYLTKPFQSRELLSRVDTHTALSRARLERDKSLHDLEAAIGQIERIHREQEAFLRHELNNAIGPILGYADMLLGHLAVDPERQRKWLVKIREGATAMHRLLTRMRELQEIERGETELILEPIDLVPLIESIITDFSAGDRENNSVLFETRLEEARVHGDMSTLRGSLANLIKNAMEHVASAAQKDDRIVKIYLGLTGEVFEVAIHNRGEPVPEERLATFFEKFNSTKTGGTGLGTSYARIIAEAHGGSARVSSTETEGTTVTLSIPAISGASD